MNMTQSFILVYNERLCNSGNVRHGGFISTRAAGPSYDKTPCPTFPPSQNLIVQFLMNLVCGENVESTVECVH